MEEQFTLTEEDLKLLNSKVGLTHLLSQKGDILDYKKALRYVRYDVRLHELQTELIKLQNWVINNNKKIVIIFEGRDAAGKGGAIRRITEFINPRHFNILALPKPTEEEEGQWYFQRYINYLPKQGEIVFFDRSWYNRAVVEPVNKFCTQEEYKTFLNQVNSFEEMLIDSGTYLMKFYFSISKEEQEKRFKEIKSSPLKKWKMTKVDEKAQTLWDTYTQYKKRMFKKTDSAHAPWTIIKANKKTKARIEVIEHILDRIPYSDKNDKLIANQESN